jgi:hypothetical protein
MPPESGDPRVCRAWLGRGVGTTFSNPLNTVQPGGSPDVPSAGASGSGDEAGVPTQATASPYGQPGPFRLGIHAGDAG